MRISVIIGLILCSNVVFAQQNDIPAVEKESDADKKVVVTDSIAVKNAEDKKDKAAGYNRSKAVSTKAKRELRNQVQEAGETEEVMDEYYADPASTTIDQTSTNLYESNTLNFNYSEQQSNVQRTQRTPSAVQQKQMDEAVGYFETNAPNSFEHHYFKYTAGNYDVNLYDHLKKAEEIKPLNTDVQIQMAGYHMIKGDIAEGIRYIDKLIRQKRLQGSVLKYAEDILLSVPKDGTLITHGFDDSYATWYNANKKGMRGDVTLVSLDFLQSEYYRNNLKKKGFKLPTNTTIDVNYLTEFCRLNAGKHIAISMTTPKEYFGGVKQNTYVTGLVMEYKEGEYANFERNRDLWNNVLKKHLVTEANDEKAKSLSSNYLPMLLQMRKVYGELGDSKSVKELDVVIDNIGAQCNKYKQVQKLKSSY